MKVSKVAATTARRLFGLCSASGQLDETKLRAVVAQLVESKPRDYRGILSALQRLTRLEMERRKVTVESAVALDAAERARLEANLTSRYQQSLQIEYRTEPALLGGLRIRVGNDVFDGSVQGRLERLAARF